MLTPEEIEGSNLPRAFVGGYKADKVTEHLRRIAWDLRRLLHERGVAETELGRLRRDVAQSQRRGELEAAVLDSAHRAAKEIRAAAREESELLLKKAREHAERLRHDVEREHAARTREIESLRTMSGTLRTELRTFLKSLLEVVEPFDPSANAERRLVMADLERVVRATRASKP